MLLILSFASLLGIFYMISKKIPALMLLSEESLTLKETFPEFLNRKTKELPSVAKDFHVGFLKSVNKQLLKSKVLSLKVHNKMNDWTEALNKKLHYKKIEKENENSILTADIDDADKMTITLASSQDNNEIK